MAARLGPDSLSDPSSDCCNRATLLLRVFGGDISLIKLEGIAMILRAVVRQAYAAVGGQTDGRRWLAQPDPTAEDSKVVDSEVDRDLLTSSQSGPAHKVGMAGSK